MTRGLWAPAMGLHTALIYKAQSTHSGKRDGLAALFLGYPACETAGGGTQDDMITNSRKV
jgi:hypothetical protein